MRVEIMDTYRPPDSSKMFFFILSNVGEFGDKFILQPQGMDLADLRRRIVGNEIAHAEDAGREYCRIFAVGLGQLCWTFNHISAVGHSVGRKGIVYSYGCVFDAALLDTYANSFFSLLYSFTVEVHRISDERSIGDAVEQFVANLNCPELLSAREQVFRKIQAIKERLLFFESQLKQPTVLQRWHHRMLRLTSFLLGHPKNLDLAVICVGQLTGDDVLTVFNAEMSQGIYWLLAGSSALATRREYSSDTLIRVVPAVTLSRSAAQVRWRQLPSGTSYIAVVGHDRSPVGLKAVSDADIESGKLIRIERDSDSAGMVGEVRAFVGDQIEVDWNYRQDPDSLPLPAHASVDGTAVRFLYIRRVQRLEVGGGCSLGAFFSATSEGKSTLTMVIGSEKSVRVRVVCEAKTDEAN